jgi:two-component system phosphate regulon sensor histidine kinase PhoR
MRSIRAKLITTYVALAAVVLIVVTAVMLGTLHRRYLDTYQYVVATQARLIATMLTAYSKESPIPREEMEVMAQRFRWRPETRITVLDAVGRHPGAPAGPPPPEVAAALSGAALAGNSGSGIRFDPGTNEERVFAAAPIGEKEALVGVVHVSMPAIWAWRQLQRVLPAFGGALALGLVAAWFIGSRLARSLTDPVEELTRAAERLREGDLDHRVQVRTGDEIGRLGEAFSTMAGRLRETIHGLTEERHKLEAILTSMVDAVVAVDRPGRVILVNRAAEDLLGVRREEVIGHPAVAALPPTLSGVLHEAATQRRLVAAELPGEGGERLVEIRCAPIRGNGEDAGTVAVLRDVTELRRSERLRRELTANVSHELRTPLTSIKGFSETLLTGSRGDDATTRRFLGIINAEADRLVKLVDDLMDLSRLEAKGVALELAPVDVPALIEEMVAHLRPLAGARRLEVSPGPRATVLGDRNRLAQVLTNLIDNAIKFTAERGRVTIGWLDQNGDVLVTVQDDGRGIPAADLPHIFERFYKADRSRSASGGSGLGLAITKHIVEAHGGWITVHSREGEGTIFTVVLPKVEGANGEAARA